MTIDRILPPDTDPFRPGPGRGFLDGRTALVTGGAKRIGHHLVLALAGEGAAVVLHYRRSVLEARQTAEAIRDHGGECFLVDGDLADPAIAADLIVRAASEAGREIDILVNNASTFAAGEVVGTSIEDWDLNQAVNLRAPFLRARELARRLAADRPGDVINLNDVRALKPGPDHFAYTISKVGLHGLTQSLALALAPSIRVNELMLGAILPPDEGYGEYRRTPVEEIPTGRFDTPREVCLALLFLRGNPAITGHSLCVDGGRHLI